MRRRWFRAATVLYLSPQTTYVFRVTARDAYGNVAESNVLSVTTPAVTDTVPPTAATNLSLSSESTPPEAWLDWDHSTNDTDPQAQIPYEVYLNGERTRRRGDRVRLDEPLARAPRFRAR
jgi:hypothetical protein